VKPAPFDYVRPGTVDEALAVLADRAGDAKLLAGGQSLVPAMNFRIAQPAVLVDLNRISALAGIEATPDGGLRIGSMTRHRALERSALVADRAPLVTETMPFVAHPPIRARGTIGGSLAHADPAAELPALMLALDATIGARSRTGARRVPATEFFVGLYATALAPDELLTEVMIPGLPAASGWAFDEVARRHGDYALAGAAAVVRLDAAGRVSVARIALVSVHERPVLAHDAARVLAGQAPTADAIAAAADAAAVRDADPPSDVHASSAYRRHLTRVLVRRVLTRALERAARLPTPDSRR
jgi:CO/xanthine dehydrogenase FAD-binding subunit